MTAWVRLNRYCELTGETPDTFKHKKSSGIFIEGIHFRLAEDKRLWLHLDRCQEWVEVGTQVQVQKYSHLINTTV